MRMLTRMMLEIFEEDEMDKWLNVKDIKPIDLTEVLGAVLVEGTLTHEVVTWDSRDGGHWTCSNDELSEPDVRFWMNLPRLPKAENG